MELHIYADKQGNVLKTELLDKAVKYSTTKQVIWEGEYASILGKIYELQYFGYLDGGHFDNFKYDLVEVDPIRDLNFIFDI